MKGIDVVGAQHDVALAACCGKGAGGCDRRGKDAVNNLNGLVVC
ncbi:hypothetical protein [Streptomyces sp. NPDC017993]